MPDFPVKKPFDGLYIADGRHDRVRIRPKGVKHVAEPIDIAEIDLDAPLPPTARAKTRTMPVYNVKIWVEQDMTAEELARMIDAMAAYVRGKEPKWD